MGLAWSMFIDRLEVNYTPWAPIVLGSYHHPACPVHWLIERNPLNNLQSLVSGQASFDIMNPVDRDLAGLVDSYWLGILSNMQAERRRVFHQRKGLVCAAVKST